MRARDLCEIGSDAIFEEPAAKLLDVGVRETSIGRRRRGIVWAATTDTKV